MAGEIVYNYTKNFGLENAELITELEDLVSNPLINETKRLRLQLLSHFSKVCWLVLVFASYFLN
jgi:hypothetical protein